MAIVMKRMSLSKSEKWMAYRDFKSLAANIQNELEDAVIMRIQALFIRKTVLEFGIAQHFAGCGCILRSYADSLHSTQSEDCRIYQIQDYISERPDFFFRCVLLYTLSRLAQPASV